MTLHIVNGTVFKEYLAKCSYDEPVIAFNESMITGESSETIFDDEFFHVRAQALGVSEEQYRTTTVVELEALLHQEHSRIVLWFDEDMFCQMNVLTLCAYLECSHFPGQVQVNIIQQDFWRYSLADVVIKSYAVPLTGFYKTYRDVLARKTFTERESPAFEEMKQGILLYKNYVSDNSEIRAAIRKMIRQGQSKQSIINEIIKNYPQYGIGDYNIELLYRKEVLKAEAAV